MKNVFIVAAVIVLSFCSTAYAQVGTAATSGSASYDAAAAQPILLTLAARAAWIEAQPGVAFSPHAAAPTPSGGGSSPAFSQT